MTPGSVTPDGSPVSVYLALPPGAAPEIIHGAIPPGGTILELACGVGRVTRPLLAYGHAIVAVDESPEMLDHVTGAEKVLADLFTLDLGRRFDAVVAASNLVNTADRQQRLALLAVCRRHVVPDGAVLVERFPVEWAQSPADEERSIGPVTVAFHLIEQRGPEFDAEVTYRLGVASWTQTFTGAAIDDETLAAEAGACGLSLDRWLDDRRMWGLLRPNR